MIQIAYCNNISIHIPKLQEAWNQPSVEFYYNYSDSPVESTDQCRCEAQQPVPKAGKAGIAWFSRGRPRRAVEKWRKMIDSPTCYSRLSRERLGKWWSTDTGMEWGTSFSDTAICMMCSMTFDYCIFTCMLYQMWLCTLLEHIHKASRNFTQSRIIWNGARKSWTRERETIVGRWEPSFIAEVASTLVGNLDWRFRIPGVL